MLKWHQKEYWQLLMSLLLGFVAMLQSRLRNQIAKRRGVSYAGTDMAPLGCTADVEQEVLVLTSVQILVQHAKYTTCCSHVEHVAFNVHESLRLEHKLTPSCQQVMT